MNITKRVDLNLGYSCNIRCRFCYYQNRMRKTSFYKDLTTKEALRRLDYIRSKGKTAVDLTGGEPTIRTDLLELIGYAKKIGFETICIITNGLRFSDKGYASSLAGAGLNDVLFSLHGHNAEIHDNLTQVPGSYDKLLKAVDNARGLGIKFRNNCVVNRLNFNSVSEHAAKLYELGFKTVNYILFNPIIDAGSSAEEMFVPYSEAAKQLKLMIDRYQSKIPRITLRYIPFCLMEGYERFVTHMPQIQYDEDEWDYIVRHNMREGALITAAAALTGMFFLPPKRLFSTDFQTLLRDGIKRFFALKACVKSKECSGCSLNYICYGLWKEYSRLGGLKELHPVKGETLYEPYHFMEGLN